MNYEISVIHEMHVSESEVGLASKVMYLNRSRPKCEASVFAQNLE